jgi:hypothetical protein
MLELCTQSARRQLRQLALRTQARRISSELRAAPAALVHALVLRAHGLGRTARAGNSCAVAEVGVDSNEVRRQAESLDVLDGDFARGVGLVVGAVAARAVELPCVDDGVVFDL